MHTQVSGNTDILVFEECLEVELCSRARMEQVKFARLGGQPSPCGASASASTRAMCPTTSDRSSYGENGLANLQERMRTLRQPRQDTS